MAKQTMTTPIGVIKFPKLNTPEKSDNGKDVWSCALSLDPKDKEVKGFLKALDDINDAVKDVNTAPYKQEKVKKEDGSLEDTGNILINFKSYYAPKIFDAQSNEIKSVVGFGSKGRVAFTTAEFNFKGKVGTSKYVNGVQITELKEGGMSAEGLGFGKVEGYTAPQGEEVAWDADLG